MEQLGIALVSGLLGGAAVGVIGGLITLVVQSREHANQRAMAREQRLQDRRARAYERALEHAYRLNDWVERTEPMIGPKPEPPPPLPDEELWRLNALTAAHASPEAQELTRAMSDAARRFQVAAWRVRDERESRTPAADPPAWTVLMESREAFYAAVRTFADRLSAELRGDI